MRNKAKESVPQFNYTVYNSNQYLTAGSLLMMFTDIGLSIAFTNRMITDLQLLKRAIE